jgi:hypothetical protein
LKETDMRATDTDRPPHPGKTTAQRRVLDEIGCGNFSPMMAKATRSALLKEGLIVSAGERVIGAGWSAVRIAEFEMPVAVHLQWCSAVAATDEEMAGLEGLL